MRTRRTKSDKSVREPWPTGRRAEHHQRPLGPEDQVGRAVQRRGMGNRDIDRVRFHEGEILFQAARARARGYRNTTAFATIIYLIAAPLGDLFQST